MPKLANETRFHYQTASVLAKNNVRYFSGTSGLVHLNKLVLALLVQHPSDIWSIEPNIPLP